MSEGVGECILTRKDPGWCADDYCHRFEPRYDEEMPIELDGAIKAIVTDNEWLPEGIAHLRKRTYVHDVCTKCGAVVQRGE